MAIQNFLSDIKLGDNIYIRLGDRGPASGGGDLNLSHNGTNSFIDNHTGQLYIRNFSDDKNIHLQSDDGSGGMTDYIVVHGSENIVKFQEHTRHLDNKEARFGTGSDLKIYHESATGDSYINELGTGDLIIKGGNDIVFKDAVGNLLANMNQSDSVELYYGGVKKFETTSAGISVTGNTIITDTSNPSGTSGSLIVEGRRDGTANLLTLRAKDASAPTVALPSGQGGIIRWQGFDGTDFAQMGAIAVVADGQAVANSDAPSRMVFYTVPDSSETLTTALTLDKSQNATFAGDVTVSGGDITASNFIAGVSGGSVRIKNSANNTIATFASSLDTTFAGDVTVEGGHQKILVGAYSNYAQSTDRLYIGGDGLASTDAAIYIGNRGNGTGYGYRIYYEGTGSGNDNKLILKSENLGSPVDMLSFTQDGKATFSNGIEVTGGSTGADIYINNTSPTLGFTDSNSFTDANDIYIVRGTSGNKLQFQWYDDSAGTTTETFNIDSSGNATFSGDVMPAAENAHNIGSASVRWEDLYVDDGYIRNAYIDEYIYHNGNTATYARFQTNRLTLNSGGGAIVDLNTNGNLYFTGHAIFYNTITLAGSSNEIIKSDGSIRIDIDNNNNQTDRIFIVSNHNAANELFKVDESGNGTFGGNISLADGWTLQNVSGGYAKFSNWVNISNTGFYTTEDMYFDLDDSSSRFVVRGLSNVELFEIDTSDGNSATFAGIIKSSNNPSSNFLDFDDDSTTHNSDSNVTTLGSVSGIALATNLNDGGGGNFTVSTGSTGTELLEITTAGNATFAGSLRTTNIGVGIAPSSVYGIYQDYNSSNANQDGAYAYYVDADFSGSDNTTGDREQGGIRLDIDSSADGDANDEHRLFGIWVDQRNTGFSDLSRAGYFYNESNIETANETTAELTGVYGIAVADSTETTAGVNNLYGVQGLTSLQDNGHVGASFAGFFKNIINTTRAANLGSQVTGVRGEVEIDSTSSITVAQVRAVDAVIDTDSGTPTITNGYLFKGTYEGTPNVTNKYGLYVTGSAKNLIDGTITLGTSGNFLSDSVFQFLNTGSGAQYGKFRGIQLSTSYSGTPPSQGILFGTDTNLYRDSANVLKTDDSLIVATDLTVEGSLYVTGTSTAVNVEDLNVEQGEITLNYAASSDTSSSANGAGIRIQDAVNATTDATMLWDASSDRFNFSHALTTATGTVRFTHQQNAGSRLELYNNRQDLSNVEVYRIAAYNSVEVTGVHFYRGGGGSSGYTKIFAKKNNASSLEEVVQFGTNDALDTTYSGAVRINAVNDAYNFKAFGQDADSWFGVYDDANNSANIILTRSDTAEMFKVMGHTGNTTIAGDLDVGNLRIVSGNDSTDQGTAWIRSNGNYIVINPVDGEHLYLNWDTGTSGGSGHVYVANNVYAQAFYDRNNTAYYVDPANTVTSIKVAGEYHASIDHGDAGFIQTWRNTNTGTSAYVEHVIGNSGSNELRIGHAPNYSSADWNASWVYAVGKPLFLKSSSGNVVTYAGGSGSANVVATFDTTLKTTFRGHIDVTNSGAVKIAGSDAINSSRNFYANHTIAFTYNPGSGGNTYFQTGTDSLAIKSTNSNPPATFFVDDGRVVHNYSTQSPIYYDKDNTGYYLDPASTGTSLKVAGKVEHQGLAPTTGTNIDQIKEFSMTFQLAANTWTDTGIDGTDLATGTYVMQVLVDDYAVNGAHYTEYYSGTISWFATNTNSSSVDEIIVHRAGHAPQSGDVQFRTQRTLNADSHDLMLQVKHNLAYNAALDGTTAGKKMIFKFRRLI